MSRQCYRLALLTVIGTSMLGLYLIIGHLHRADSLVLAMPEAVPFVPALALPYLALLGVAWFLPLALRSDRLFAECVMAGVLAYLLVAPWWLLVPTILPRPPLTDHGWTTTYRWLIAIDAPSNIFPCAHVLGPSLAAWYAARDRPAWRWWLAASLALGIPTIALTWQHRPVDILIGLLCAALAALVVGSAYRPRLTTSGPLPTACP